MRAQSATASKRRSAFNEVSLLRETRQAAKLRVVVDGKVRLGELSCDGILVSTPAGSTAYNLSAHWSNPAHRLGTPGDDAAKSVPAQALAGRPAPASGQIRFDILEPDKRPVSATADNLEVRDVTSVDVAEDRSREMTMLFDAGHSLDERRSGGTVSLY